MRSEAEIHRSARALSRRLSQSAEAVSLIILVIVQVLIILGISAALYHLGRWLGWWQ
jgi:hypothetical protein